MKRTAYLVGVVRTPVQILFYLIEGLLSLVERIQDMLLGLVFKKQFVRQGGCAHTGECCRAIGIEVPRAWLKYPRLIRLIRSWHFLRYNFTDEGVQNNLLVYSCNYLTTDNLCGIHRWKPKLCRDFPVTPWFGITKLHKGCGYRFEKRVGKDFGKILRQSP